MCSLQGRRLIVEITARFDYLTPPKTLGEEIAREQTDLVVAKMAFDLQDSVKLLLDRNIAIISEYLRRNPNA